MKGYLTLFFLFVMGIAPSAQAGKFGLQSVSAFIGGVGGYNFETERFPYSPILGGGLEAGTKRIALYADIHTLPFFTSRGPDCVISSTGSACESSGARSYVMTTLGMTVGTNIVRAGPYFTAGYKGFSAGGRLLITPRGTMRLGRHGVEWRLGYYLPNVMYVGAMYTWRFTNFKL